MAFVPEEFNDKYLNVTSYPLYIGDLYYSKIRSTNNDPYSDSLQKILDSLVAEKVISNMPPESAEFFMANRLAKFAGYYPVTTSEKNLKLIKKYYPHSKYIPELEEKVALKRKLSAGNPALDFDIATPDNRKMRLSDLKGKVVLLDFWASWCGPCRAEFPHSKKIHDYFKDKPVAFVYVSIDDDTVSWRKAIEQNHIEGINTCSPGTWSSKVAQLYGVQGVPSYFLIDKNGNFAVDETPRPSQENELIAAIERLLD